MFKLFKTNKKLPPFAVLKAFPDKDKYFRRIASWVESGDYGIIVTDPNAPRIITMDPWPQLVFLAADGQRTIEQYIYYMAGQYTGKVPDKLDETIIHEIGTLQQERLIELCDTQKRPEPRFDQPGK